MQSTQIEILRRVGLKVTDARLSILASLRKEVSPLSPEKIARSLRGRMDTATVYRVLEVFMKKGIVRRVNLGHVHAHYELVRPNDHHHHMVCESCGLVEDVTVPEPTDLEKSVLRTSINFASVSSHAIEFFGVCNRCS